MQVDYEELRKASNIKKLYCYACKNCDIKCTIIDFDEFIVIFVIIQYVHYVFVKKTIVFFVLIIIKIHLELTRN